MKADDEGGLEAPPRLQVGKAPLALAALALLLCWIPYLGVALSVAAFVLALRLRGSARVGWALGLSVYAFLLGAGFTALQIAFAPEPVPASRAPEWEAFERLFDPEDGAGGDAQAP